MEKDRFADQFWDDYFCMNFLITFLSYNRQILLLCKYYVLNVFNMIDFVQIFVISRSTDILI